MATLTETSLYTRRIVKYGSVGIVALFVLRTVIVFSISVWKKFHPPPLPAPTVSFGKLPAVAFPTQEKIGGLQFTIETPDNSLPELPDRANVYFMPYLRPNLLALERAKQEAELIGFREEPQLISEKIYRWDSSQQPNLTLEMDIFVGSFSYQYDWRLDPTILSEKNLPGIEQAKTESQNFLQKAGVLESDLFDSRMEVNYLKLDGKNLVSSASPSEAQFVNVEMFRKNINDLPVVTYNPQKGIVSLLISSSKDSNKRIVEVKFNYFPIKYDSSATYPIKTALKAFGELQNGQAFIASWNGSGTKVTIRRVYLAYFDSLEPQQYLQPIVVFEGDDGFFGYVTAISPDWIR